MAKLEKFADLAVEEGAARCLRRNKAGYGGRTSGGERFLSEGAASRVLSFKNHSDRAGGAGETMKKLN